MVVERVVAMVVEGVVAVIVAVIGKRRSRWSASGRRGGRRREARR
jgi:hypothetical protein